MATTTARPAGTGNGAGNGAGWWGGGPGGDGFRQPPLLQNNVLGMLFALAGISMLFIALTSSYVVRHGFDSTWTPAPMPRLLPLNTLLILMSSASMERTRGAATSGSRWLAVTLLLGIGFLAGQLVVWRQLANHGIYLGATPHSSFFYLLTGLHGLHLLGGVAAVGFLESRAWRDRWADAARWLNVTALYWHFMAGLWAYLVVLLFAWR